MTIARRKREREEKSVSCYQKFIFELDAGRMKEKARKKQKRIKTINKYCCLDALTSQAFRFTVLFLCFVLFLLFFLNSVDES